VEFSDGFYVTKTLPFGMEISFDDDDVIQSLDEHESYECRINKVEENSQAEKMGVKENWKIVSVDGKKINGLNFDELRISIESEIKQDITFKNHEVNLINIFFLHLFFFFLV
jgi:C-terminal processing protease CtpA/Prc